MLRGLQGTQEAYPEERHWGKHLLSITPYSGIYSMIWGYSKTAWTIESKLHESGIRCVLLRVIILAHRIVHRI